MIEIKSHKTGDGVAMTMTLDGKAVELGFEAASVIVTLIKRLHELNPAGVEIVSAVLKAETKGLHVLEEESEESLQ